MKKVISPVLALAWAAIIWQLTTTPDFKVTEDTLLSLLISNGGHFIFFGVQALLLRFTIYDIRYTIYSDIVPVTISSLYGAYIEYIQLTTPGRSADPLDWVLDTLGAITFLFFLKKLQSSHNA